MLKKVEEYFEVVQALEWRVYGSSVLLVYEGDVEALQAAYETGEGVAGRKRSRDDEDEGETDESSSESESESGSDEEEENSKRRKPRPAFSVKAIDFAHAWSATGEGPDEGYNLGLRTVIQLLRARIEELATET